VTDATTRRAELMSPAGSPDAACAAFHYGADSIYLGLKSFSARAEAANFTLEEADAITAYAHSLTPRRKVFAAVNTLVLQDELKPLAELLGAVADIGMDAVIVQDLGVFRVVRKHFPELRLHASTQMAVHNRQGVEVLRDLGFARVTLARELTLNEIREIVAAVPDVETEAFIHGALCYSYSGLCLFSSHVLGRSGNRGRCAYMCRDHFRIGGGQDGHVFSMKDLALPDEVRHLCDAGVTSFKIEGRMKSPLYVAATTDYYRKLIDGTLRPDERARHEADIQAIFSRPWTDLFTESRKHLDVADPDWVGHRGTPAGQAESVFRDRAGKPWLRFKASRAIEKHDGLQIDLSGLAKPFGFAVDDLRIAGESGTVFDTPTDAVVEVRLPSDHPTIPRGATVYCASSQDVKRRYRFDPPKAGRFRSRRAMDVTVKLDVGKLAVSARAGTAQTESELKGPFSPAKDPAKTESAVRTAFEKLGDTRFSLGELRFQNSAGLFVPVSQLNQLRRDLTAALESKLADSLTARIREVEADMVRPDSAFRIPHSAFRWSLKTDRLALLDAFESGDWKGLDEVVVEIDQDPLPFLQKKLAALAECAGRDRIRLALPLITRRWEEDELVGKIAALRAAGWEKWEAANISAWTFLLSGILLRQGSGGQVQHPASGIALSCDWSVYVTNRAAALQVADMGASRFALSPEDGLANMRPLLAEFGAKATVVVYQDTPLFIAESCVHAISEKGCPGRAKCDFRALDMVSSHGDEVIAVDRRCRTVVVNRQPFCIASRLKDLAGAGAVSLRADFVYRPYSPDQVRNLWRALRSGKNLPSGHLGNFDRGLL
jgi:U32 family peptidase